MSGQIPLAVDLSDVTPITWGGDEAARFLLRGSDTGGLFSFFEVRVPAGEGSLYHLHEEADETFYVVDGEFEITVGDQVHKATPGVLVYGPRGISHQFQNVSAGTSTMYCVMTPGGIETFYEELSGLATQVPPPPWEARRDLAARHRIVAKQPDQAHFTERTRQVTDIETRMPPRADEPFAAPEPFAVPDPLADVPRHLRRMFKPKTKPPSRLNRTVNRAFVKLNVALFRASSGRVAGRMMGMDILLLTTIGRRTGIPTTNALMYLWDQGRFVVCAAYGGEIVHPSWYLNLLAVPEATVELGPETLRVTATTLPAGPERERLWDLMVHEVANYARYQTMTTRELPIIVLTPVD